MRLEARADRRSWYTRHPGFETAVWVVLIAVLLTVGIIKLAGGDSWGWYCVGFAILWTLNFAVRQWRRHPNAGPLARDRAPLADALKNYWRRARSPRR